MGYTKFYESYNKNTIKVESNVTDFSVSYLFESPTYLWGSALSDFGWRSYRVFSDFRHAHQC